MRLLISNKKRLDYENIASKAQRYSFRNDIILTELEAFQISLTVVYGTSDHHHLNTPSQNIDGSETENIRIYHEFEGRIEKSVPRIIDWHHEACRVMTIGDPKGQIFLSHPHMNKGFFFLLTIICHILCLEKGSKKFLNTLRCEMT